MIVVGTTTVHNGSYDGTFYATVAIPPQAEPGDKLVLFAYSGNNPYYIDQGDWTSLGNASGQEAQGNTWTHTYKAGDPNPTIYTDGYDAYRFVMVAVRGDLNTSSVSAQRVGTAGVNLTPATVSTTTPVYDGDLVLYFTGCRNAIVEPTLDVGTEIAAYSSLNTMGTWAAEATDDGELTATFSLPARTGHYLSVVRLNVVHFGMWQEDAEAIEDVVIDSTTSQATDGATSLNARCYRETWLRDEDTAPDTGPQTMARLLLGDTTVRYGGVQASTSPAPHVQYRSSRNSTAVWDQAIVELRNDLPDSAQNFTFGTLPTSVYDQGAFVDPEVVGVEWRAPTESFDHQIYVKIAPQPGQETSYRVSPAIGPFTVKNSAGRVARSSAGWRNESSIGEIPIASAGDQLTGTWFIGTLLPGASRYLTVLDNPTLLGQPTPTFAPAPNENSEYWYPFQATLYGSFRPSYRLIYNGPAVIAPPDPEPAPAIEGQIRTARSRFISAY